jgi:hypothetical protein
MVAGRNPFAALAQIEYGLSHAGHVRLEVFDLAGRRIETLVDGDLPAGVRRTSWDAARFQPGVYLARFEGPGVNRTLRLVHAN